MKFLAIVCSSHTYMCTRKNKTLLHIGFNTTLFYLCQETLLFICFFVRVCLLKVELMSCMFMLCILYMQVEHVGMEICIARAMELTLWL